MKVVCYGGPCDGLELEVSIGGAIAPRREFHLAHVDRPFSPVAMPEPTPPVPRGLMRRAIYHLMRRKDQAGAWQTVYVFERVEVS